MIPAAAVLAVVLTTSAERNALEARWTHAARAGVPANRRLHDGPAPPQSALAPLHALAVAELRVSGRYHLHDVAGAPRAQTLWERLWTWLANRWNALLNALFGRARVNPTVAGAVGDVIVALLVLAVAAAALRILVAFGRRSQRASSIRLLTPDTDAATLYAMAVERADRGEFAAASQLLFRATRDGTPSARFR